METNSNYMTEAKTLEECLEEGGSLMHEAVIRLGEDEATEAMEKFVRSVYASALMAAAGKLPKNIKCDHGCWLGCIYAEQTGPYNCALNECRSILLSMAREAGETIKE